MNKMNSIPDISEDLEVRWVQGFTNNRVALLDEKTACFPSGNYITFLNVQTKKREVLQSPGHGIGAFTANGRRRTFAFSEQRRSPSIFVYTYPELNLSCELKGNAKLAYTALAVSDTGPYLASCSSLPDYTITVWNLEEGISICSCQLTEDDVTTLLFHPLNWQQICAVNSKSLTVWNIERSKDFHVMEPRFIELPDTDGSVLEKEVNTSYTPSGKLTYSGPQMPTSAIAGLIGEKADKILPLMRGKPRLTPSAICWSGSSDLYVGTKEGFLLLVNIESLIVSILYNPIKQSPSDCSESLVIQEGNFQSLALYSDSVFATGHDGVLQTLKIKDNAMKVVETLKLEEAVSSLCFSPGYETLLLSSETGHIYKYNPGLKNEAVKVLDVLCGDIITAVPVYTEKNLCVSVRESGELQLWSLENGDCIASVSLQTKVTCLASCPIAQYVAVGTVMGHILFVDLTRAEKPRLVHSVHLYHVPVEHLVFDQGGNFLITGAFDSQIFLLDTRPTKTFEIIGYTDIVGSIVSLSTQYQKENKQVDVLILCNSEKMKKNKKKNNNMTDKEHKEGNLLMLLSVSTQISANGVDRHRRLRDEVIQTCLYEIPHSLSSCVLGANNIFGYCHQKKVLQRFQLLQSVDKISSKEKTDTLHADKEVAGHPLGIALLHLSPNQCWLASVGTDGLLRIHDSSTLDIYVQKQCHSWWLGGIRSVSFSPDSQTVITSGLRDGSLVCSRLSLKMAAAAQYGLSVVASSVEIISQENLVLHRKPSQTLVEQPASNGGQVTNYMTDKNEDSDSLPSTSPYNSTWLDNKLNTVLKEERQQFVGNRSSLKKRAVELWDMIHVMMQENEKLPEMEKLELLEFNLDLEDQKRLQTDGKQEVIMVRKDIELAKLANRYLCDILKKKYWDSMKVKDDVIKAFHSGCLVDNFPMKDRSAKELDDLYQAQNLEESDKADLPVLRSFLNNLKSTSEGSGDDEDRVSNLESLNLTGSPSAQYGGSTCHLCNQLYLSKNHMKRRQIILLQNSIYQLKTAFNKEFEALYKQKEQEISRIRDRNKRITEIMSDLGFRQETLWEPTLVDEERPERMFTVSDSEIKVEKYITPEQRKREEDQRKEEEQRRLTSEEDNIRQRALDHLMGGVLEVKKLDILKMEVPPPEFIDTPESEWTEEERRTYKEYEKKVKELSDEQDKYRTSLEAEMKKLQEAIKDATNAFDQALNRLYDKKVETEKALCQEELQIANLLRSLLTEEQMLNTEEDLNYRLKKKQAVKNQIGKVINNQREYVEAFQESYDSTVAEDKVKKKALMLAEMQAFLQKRTRDLENAQMEISKVNQDIRWLQKERSDFCLNVMVQILLKQGQVEVDPGDFIEDFSDSLMIHRHVVEDLNNTIEALTEQKIANMVECKDINKGIIQLEWEHKRLSKQTDDLTNKARDIQMVCVTRELREYLKDASHDSRMSKMESAQEKAMEIEDKNLKKKIEHCEHTKKRLHKETEDKKKSIAALDLEIAELELTIAQKKKAVKPQQRTTFKVTKLRDGMKEPTEEEAQGPPQSTDS